MGLVVFYVIWGNLVVAGGYWQTVCEHWGIAVAMALGSYFAGSTPTGGGIVGFPVLVLLFDQSAEIGRNFSFAVQSVGMVSASCFIFATGHKLATRILVWSMLAGLITLPLSTVFLVPMLSPLFVKLLFAVIWASFGVMHFVRLHEICAIEGTGSHTPELDRTLGIAAGVLGGILSSVTGVGIDMLLYAVLVMLFRTDLKIAIPTSVVSMAFLSVVGLMTNGVLGNLEPEVFGNWLAASPIVVIGAPIGALIVHFMSRKTCFEVNVSEAPLMLALIGILGFNCFFHLMYVLGRRRGERHSSLSLQTSLQVRPSQRIVIT
jgi:uncharacterized membrane protein YfcA